MASALNSFIQKAANINKDFSLDENNPVIKEIANTSVDLIQELGAQAIPEEQRPSWEDVRSAAIEILLTAKAIQKKEIIEYDHMQKLIRTLSNQSNKKELNALNITVQNLKKTDLQDTLRYRELMSKVFNLQNLTNEILGQKIKLIFAYAKEDGSVVLYEHDRNTVDYWSDRGRILSSMAKDISDNETARILENKSLDKLDATYKEVYTRAQYAKSKIKNLNKKRSKRIYNLESKKGLSNKEIKDTVKENTEFAFYLLWKNGGKWMRYRVGSQGIILEAYFNFFIHKDNAFQLVEPAVGRYILVGMAAVDNASGFLEGDVSVGSIQYAVKGLNASAMGYYEIVTKYASEISLIADEASGIKYLQKLKEDLHSSAAPLLKQSTAKEMTKTLNDLLTSFGNSAQKESGGSWVSQKGK